jgi:glycosyltransferase involved in cell wall biosynthesis
MLASGKRLVFIPQVLETFCRTAAEAKMLNCKLITKPKMLGFSSESCFQLSGIELINDIRLRIKNALKLFEDLLNGKSPTKTIKKAAFIGKFRRLYDEEGKARSLEEEGVEVKRFDETTFNKYSPNDLTTLLEYKPDVVFFTKLRVPRAQELIDECKRRGIKTVCWMPDLYFGLQREQEVLNKTPMFRADYVFSPDGGNQKKFEECGVKHHLMRQAIFKDSCELRKEEKKYDVLFVGTLGPEHGSPRAKLLKFLEIEYGNRFYWAGRTGPHEIRNDSLTKLISESKIVIGDCVYSKNYWSNRIYETLGRGGFLIHPNIPGLEDEFEHGKHLLTFEYGNLTELKSTIEEALHDDFSREIIRENGMKHVKKNHTLRNRAHQVLEVLNNE